MWPKADGMTPCIAHAERVHREAADHRFRRLDRAAGAAKGADQAGGDKGLADIGAELAVTNKAVMGYRAEIGVGQPARSQYRDAVR